MARSGASRCRHGSRSMRDRSARSWRCSRPPGASGWCARLSRLSGARNPTPGSITLKSGMPGGGGAVSCSASRPCATIESSSTIVGSSSFNTILKTRPSVLKYGTADGTGTEQPARGGILLEASRAGVGEVHDARVVRVGGQVLDADELEHVVRVRPVLETRLGPRARRATGDVIRDVDELAGPGVARLDLQEVVGVVLRIGSVDGAGIGAGHPEGPQVAAIGRRARSGSRRCPCRAGTRAR